MAVVCKLAAFSFTDPTLSPGMPIRAVHITELRSALNGAYVAAGLTLPTYTDPTITADVTIVKAAHITELRNAVSAIE